MVGWIRQLASEFWSYSRALPLRSAASAEATGARQSVTGMACRGIACMVPICWQVYEWRIQPDEANAGVLPETEVRNAGLRNACASSREPRGPLPSRSADDALDFE